MTIEDKLMIGTQAGGTAGMVTVESLMPKSGQFVRSGAWEVTPVYFSRYVKRGDGTVVGMGMKQAEWHLNGIREAHWDTLKSTYLTGQSTWVYMRTYSEDGKTWANYLALAILEEGPITRDHDTNVVLDFTIRFEQMVEQ